VTLIADIGNGFIDFIAPKYCLVCNNAIERGDPSTYLCDECYHNMPFAPSSEEIMDRMFEIWNADEIAISRICSLFSVKDENYMNLIHNLKYYSLKNIGIELGKLLGNRLLQDNMNEYDGIIPVPIHNTKERERGYNQSFFIAKGVSEILQIAPNNNLVRRKIYTQTQTTLNVAQRKSNVEDIFEINNKNNSSLIKNTSFLLIDDVFTTGSTLNSLATTLLNAGARKIDCATLGVA
jgi:ComF family protein